MNNLIQALTIENANRQKQFKTELSNTQTFEHWMFRSLLPKGKYLNAIKDPKQYLLDRWIKKQSKTLAKEIEHVKEVFNSNDLNSITVSIEWKKNRTWGSNPTAEAKIYYSDFNCCYFESGSIGGCGYDKGSTAFAQALNQSKGFLKLMYALKDANIETSNHDLFGYGSGYGILPRLEGGVGVSCYPSIFEKLGFKMRTVASGKSYDAYLIEKI